MSTDRRHRRPAGRRRHGALVVLAALLLGLPAGGLPARAQPLTAPLPLAAAEPVVGPPGARVVVRWADGVGPEHRAAVLTRHLGTAAAVDLTARTSLVAAPAGRPDVLAARLGADPALVAAEPDREVVLRTEPPAVPDHDPPPPAEPALLASQWGLRNTGQRVGLDGMRQGVAGIDARVVEAWRTTRGDAAVRVAVVDTAIDRDHPDLVGAVVDELLVVAPTGSRAHGTGVAGIVAARHLGGTGLAGVAPEVSLISVVAFTATDDTLPVRSTLAGVTAALELAAEAGAHVVTASWVAEVGGPVLAATIAELGVPVVAAAGNDGMVLAPDAGPFPATLGLTNLVTVTAIGPTGQVPAFANTGAEVVALAAPGEAVLVAAPGGAYRWEDGTSTAVPFVAGALALALSAEPELRTPELLDALVRTTRPLEALEATTSSGGMLDADALVRGIARPVCPRGAEPPLTFTDVATDHPHRAAIACLVDAGVARGRSSERFAPQDELTRGQLASMLVAGAGLRRPLPEPSLDVFADVGPRHTHARAIGVLHALGVASGRPDGSFAPDDPVSRGQAAALAVRTHQAIVGAAPPPSRRWFDDTGASPFADDIDRARDLGLVRGTGTVGYRPELPLLRGQAATLLARTLDAAARPGEVEGEDHG